MAELGVNVDHIATIRQSRRIDYPDPVKAASICEAAGCDSIVCHLREDRRHIQDSDLYRLRKSVKKKLNLEMAVSAEIMRIALEVKPDQAMLVPEKRGELITEGGLDVAGRRKSVESAIMKLESAGIATSLFIDPSARQVRAAFDSGARMIELHTGSYANAGGKKASRRQLEILKRAAGLAKELGLEVFAGHGLNYDNVKPLTRIKEIEEYNIGHSIVARAFFVGLRNAVKEMKGLVS